MPGNVDIITNNLNEIISTKNEFKQIIQENGLTAGTVFSEYPNKIRSLIGGGSVSGDTINSYISAYLDSYNFIDQNELSANSYVTISDIPDISTKADKSELNSYLSVSNLTKPAGVDVLRLLTSGLEINTAGNIYPSWFSYTNLVNGGNYNWIGSGTLKNYVNGRLAEIEASYVTTIDENIIPKESGTYTLGDSTYLYSNVYSSSLNVGNNSRVYNDGGGITLSINNNAGVRLGSSNLYPKTSGAFSLGTSSNFWNATYTSDVWLGADSRLSFRSSNQVNLYMNGNWRYVFHVNNFSPVFNTINLGTSTTKWNNTYTSNIYADNAYISSETYLPVNTYWYDGTTYHWLGSLFN